MKAVVRADDESAVDAPAAEPVKVVEAAVEEPVEKVEAPQEVVAVETEEEKPAE